MYKLRQGNEAATICAQYPLRLAEMRVPSTDVRIAASVSPHLVTQSCDRVAIGPEATLVDHDVVSVEPHADRAAGKAGFQISPVEPESA
jgi:hypothetical protein